MPHSGAPPKSQPRLGFQRLELLLKAEPGFFDFCFVSFSQAITYLHFAESHSSCYFTISSLHTRPSPNVTLATTPPPLHPTPSFHTPDDIMAGEDSGQAQTQPPSKRQHRGSSRGRRGGRGGRGRGQSNAGGSTSRQDTTGASQTPNQNSSPAQGGRPRRGGPRRVGRGSASSAPQPSAGPSTRRAFGGHLTTGNDDGDDDDENSPASIPPSLSADAPEFVPGQAMPVRRLETPYLQLLWVSRTDTK